MNAKHPRARLALAAGLSLLACFNTTGVNATEKKPGDAVAAAKDTLKLGCLMSETGVGAEAGTEVFNGIKLYFEQIKFTAGGHRVEIVTANDASSSDTAKDRIKDLVEKDHVDMIDGLLSSRIVHDCASLADTYKIPIVVPIGAEDDVTQRHHPHYIVRVSWSASQTAQPFGEWVYKKLGYKRVAILGVDYAYGWQNAAGFQRTFEEAGGQIVQKLWAPLGFLDYSTLMKKIRKDADAVYLISTWGASDITVKQYKEFGPGLPMIGNGATFDEPMFKYIPESSVGAISSFSYSAALNNPANKKFVAAYEARYHETPGLYAESGYVSAMWIAKALEMMKGADIHDKDKLLQVLTKVELNDAPRGPIKLDEYANPIENIYVRKLEKVNGKLQNTVIHTFPKVSQFWKWTPAEFLKNPVYSKTYPPCTHCEKD